MRQSQTSTKNMGVNGDRKHGDLKNYKIVGKVFETLDRTQLKKHFHGFMLYLTNCR